MQDETLIPEAERPIPRLLVRLGKAEIPTLLSNEVCPKCNGKVQMPKLTRTGIGVAMVNLVPDAMLQRGAEMRVTCGCGQEMVLYTSRVVTALGRMR